MGGAVQNAVEYDDAPMGSEDARDRGGDDIEASYIDVTSLIQSNLPASRLYESKVVVGRKGSGKTHVLLHLQNLARKQGRDVIYTNLDRNLFQGRGLLPYHGTESPEQCMALWAAVWRIALSMAAVSHFTARRISSKARQAVQDCIGEFVFDSSMDVEQLSRRFCDTLRERHGDLIPDADSPLDPVRALEDIIRRYKNLRSLNAFLESVDYRKLESDVSILLHRYGTLQFLIDGLDEYAWSDPKGWLELQVGLFTAAFELATVRTYTQHLKLTIALRNYVFTRASQSPHVDRARSHILTLNWNFAAARNFLNQRLRKLANGNFARSEHLAGDRPLVKWLGFDTVKSPLRSSAEDVEQYMLRHSRLSPRNLVEVFNSLCAVQNALHREHRQLGPEQFRDIVEQHARSVGDLMLKVAAEEILAILPPPPDIGRKSITPEYAVTGVAEKIATTISECSNEVINRDTCSKSLIQPILMRLGFLKEADDVDLGLDLEAALWRSGIFAYQRESDAGSHWLFSWSSNSLGPAGNAQTARYIGFHSCLIGCCSLTASPNGPVF